MNKKYLFLIGILVIVIVVGSFIWRNIKDTHSDSPAKSSITERAPLPKEVTVILTKDGFSPS